MGFKVEVDLSRRLLQLSYAGVIGPEEARRCCEEVQTRLPDLESGFRLLTDLTRLESMEPSCALYMKRIMDLCDAKGVALVVRIISDSTKDIGFNIMSLFHYTHDVPIVTCSSQDEAENALAPGL